MRKFLFFVFACAVATAGAAQTVKAGVIATPAPTDYPVIIVENSHDQEIIDQLQGISDTFSDLYDFETITNFDTYYGAIASTYLEYMRGYLSKLAPNEHYVGARTGQYDYIFAYGADLDYTGSVFTGAVTVVRWNTYNNGSMSVSYDSSFRLNPGSYLVYSDLTQKYPALATSSDFTLRQILIVFTIFCLFMTIDHMYQVRKIKRIRRGKA